MKAAVGLLVGVKVGCRNAIILQRRSRTQSFPGACQVTVHGQLTDKEFRMGGLEGYAAAMLRETNEELGAAVGRLVYEKITAANSSLVLLNIQSVKGKTVKTFGLMLDISYEHFLEMVVPSSEVDCIHACTSPKDIKPLTKELHRVKGVSRKEIRMFQDEISAIELAFDMLFSPPQGNIEGDEKEA